MQNFDHSTTLTTIETNRFRHLLTNGLALTMPRCTGPWTLGNLLSLFLVALKLSIYINFLHHFSVLLALIKSSQ